MEKMRKREGDRIENGKWIIENGELNKYQS